MEHSYDDVAKIAIVGPEGAGKSCLVARFVDNSYNAPLTPTIGVDFKLHTSVVDGKKTRCHVWDTTGASRFARITHPYYRVSQGVLLVYDASDPEGLVQAAAWLDSVAQYAPASCSIVLVGAKADLLSEDERALRTSEAVGVARSRGVRLHTLTSARTGTGVVEAFGMLVREIRYQAQQPAAARQQPLVVRSGADSAPWCSPGCCAPVVGCCLPYWPWSQPSRTPLVHAGRHSHVAAAAHVEMGSRMVAGATIV